MALFTIGEVPVDRISNDDNRVTHFGVHSSCAVCNFCSPLLGWGGAWRGGVGGQSMLPLYAVCVAGSAVLFAIGHASPPLASLDDRAASLDS